MAGQLHPNGALYRCRRAARHALEETALGTEDYRDTARILESIENLIEKQERFELTHLKVTAKTQNEFNRAQLNGVYHKPQPSITTGKPRVDF